MLRVCLRELYFYLNTKRSAAIFRIYAPFHEAPGAGNRPWSLNKMWWISNHFDVFCETSC